MFDAPHLMTGGTYAFGGTREARLNVTCNYGDIYRRVLGEDGIRSIYGMTGAESVPVLDEAASKLSDDATDDYWEATEGNAKRPLLKLAAMARMRPDGIWDGDRHDRARALRGLPRREVRRGRNCERVRGGYRTQTENHTGIRSRSETSGNLECETCACENS